MIIKRKTENKYRVLSRFYTLMIAVVIIIFSIIFKRTVFTNIDLNAKGNHGCDFFTGNQIMLYAKGYINTPGLRYDDRYFAGGYPPKKVGVCTDVVWNALRAVDVDLKVLVDRDIAQHPEAYRSVISKPDPSINYRTVPVLNIFLRRNCVRVSKDITNPLVWQPGDFIVFQGKHIAVASAMRNMTGYPYIIQHGKDPAGDEDRLLNDDGLKMTGHFRWPETIKIGGIYE